LGGLFVVLCSIASILFSNDISISAAIYFLLAIFVLISNVFVYAYLNKSHLLSIYSLAIQDANNEHEPLIRTTAAIDDHENFTSLALRQRLFVAYKHTKWNFFAICSTFICTLALFPAYLSKIQPAYPSTNYPLSVWTTRLYAQVMTFLLFNLGDTLGRMISSRMQMPSLVKPRLLFAICLSRFIFIPLFGFCHFPNTHGFPYLFKHDLIYALLVLLFSMSHGYCNSLNMMFAPRRVHTQLSGTVGTLMLLVSRCFVCPVRNNVFYNPITTKNRCQMHWILYFRSNSRLFTCMLYLGTYSRHILWLVVILRYCGNVRR
jgi:hypothetical protein